MACFLVTLMTGYFCKVMYIYIYIYIHLYIRRPFWRRACENKVSAGDLTKCLLVTWFRSLWPLSPAFRLPVVLALRPSSRIVSAGALVPLSLATATFLPETTSTLSSSCFLAESFPPIAALLRVLVLLGQARVLVLQLAAPGLRC